MVERSRLPDDPSFGWWVTGLIDGEGCFYASYSIKEKLSPSGRIHRCFNQYIGLQVQLRADDRETLEKLVAYFGVGAVREKPVSKRRRAQIPGANPSVTLRVESLDDLVEKVIPHFDRFPLQSKKSQDYDLWRQLVVFVHQNLHGKKGWLRRFPEQVGNVVSLVGRIQNKRTFQVQVASVGGG
jgi:hypothetical protein